MSDNDFQEKVNRLSMMEQNSQYLSSQRQSFQNQMLEIGSALEELESSSESYKIVGTVMVKVEKLKLKKELEEKKEVVDIRIKSIEKQEKQIKEKSEKLRDEVLKSMDNKKDGD